MLLLLIAVDVGRLFYGWVNINNAARIAASYAAAAPASNFGPGSTYEATVLSETNQSNCTLVTVSTPTFSPDTNVGSTGTVSLNCSFKILTPFMGEIVGDPMTLSATSIFVVRGGVIAGVPISTSGVPVTTTTATGTTTTGTTTTGTTTTGTTTTGTTTVAPCPSGQLAVPNLVGLTVVAARTDWSGAGFSGAFTPNTGAKVEDKVVTGQNPAVGDCLAKNSKMAVQYAP